QIRFTRPLGRRRRFFEHDESVRPAEAERIDRGEARTIAGRPVVALSIDEERTGGEGDLGGWLLEGETWRGFFVVECQGSLDQRSEPSRLFQVSNVGLHRADRTEAAPFRSSAKRTRQCVDL